MSNWELIMPGGGLTALGMGGIVLSYGGIAHTFIDGLHALSGLLFFLGLIFLSTGILDGGVSTSNRAKATVLVVISIVLAFGAAAFIGNTSPTLPTISGILILITIPSVVIAYMAMKMPQYVKPVGLIFIIAVGIGISTFFVFGVYGPSEYLIPKVIEETTEEIAEMIEPTSPIFAISILSGSSEQGAPDYNPDNALVEQGYVIEWTNNDEVSHTVTSSLDFGETFDSGLMDAGGVFQLDTTNLALGAYEYLCIVHPWMIATFVVEEPKGQVMENISIPVGGDNNIEGQIYYDPQNIIVTKTTTVVWTNNDQVVHTVTSSLDFGETFDSGLMDAGGVFQLDTTNLALGAYEYLCIVHPWMIATFVVEEPKGQVVANVSIPVGGDNNVEGQIYYEPQNIIVTKTTAVVWTNNDQVVHTVTSSLDFGETFDSGLMDAGGVFQLDTTNLALGAYEYLCIVHPWMTGSITVE